MERAMQNAALEILRNRVAEISQSRPVGRVHAVDGHLVRVAGLEKDVRLGDRLRLFRSAGSVLDGEVLRIDADSVTMLPDKVPSHVALLDRVISQGPVFISPTLDWVGRVVDPYGQPMDQFPLRRGDEFLDVMADPPPPMTRKDLGARLDTGFHIFNTMLPIVRGQRVGIFAGSGVGKSILLADFVKSIEADFVVLALVGERGREIRHFTQKVLGAGGMARTVVVAASADAPPTERARCPLTAMRVAEFLRDHGKQVLLVVDSITRFAEAHREVAVSAGEFPGLRGFPASTPSRITKLVERAGPGPLGLGDITAIFSVLVAGSDMNEPVADMLRGVLDGHIVLDRDRAERGQFPAVNLLASVSRSLPEAASQGENELINKARRLASLYEDAAAMISTGLYSKGTSPGLDQAVDFQPDFEIFLTDRCSKTCSASFERLSLLMRKVGGMV
jgi:flagellum-specific ATP synthase